MVEFKFLKNYETNYGLSFQIFYRLVFFHSFLWSAGLQTEYQKNNFSGLIFSAGTGPGIKFFSFSFFALLHYQYEIKNKDGEKTSKSITKVLSKPLLFLNSFKKENDYCLINLPKRLYGRSIQSSQNTYELKNIPLYCPEKLSIDVITSYIGLMLNMGIRVPIELDSYVFCSHFNDKGYVSFFYSFGTFLNLFIKEDRVLDIYYYNKTTDQYTVKKYETKIKGNKYLIDV